MWPSRSQKCSCLALVCYVNAYLEILKMQIIDSIIDAKKLLKPIYYMQSKFIDMIKINDTSGAIISAPRHLFIVVFLLISFYFHAGVIRKSGIFAVQYKSSPFWLQFLIGHNKTTAPSLSPLPESFCIHIAKMQSISSFHNSEYIWCHKYRCNFSKIIGTIYLLTN